MTEQMETGANPTRNDRTRIAQPVYAFVPTRTAKQIASQSCAAPALLTGAVPTRAQIASQSDLTEQTVVHVATCSMTCPPSGARSRRMR